MKVKELIIILGEIKDKEVEVYVMQNRELEGIDGITISKEIVLKRVNMEKVELEKSKFVSIDI